MRVCKAAVLAVHPARLPPPASAILSALLADMLLHARPKFGMLHSVARTRRPLLYPARSYLQRRRDRQGASFTYEVIIVDDGSRDGTARAASEFVRKHGFDAVRVLRLPQNRGKGYAGEERLLDCRAGAQGHGAHHTPAGAWVAASNMTRDHVSAGDAMNLQLNLACCAPGGSAC